MYIFSNLLIIQITCYFSESISNEVICPAIPSKNTFFHQTNSKSTQQGVSTAYSTYLNNEKKAGNFGAFSATNEKSYDGDSGFVINNSTADDINQTSFAKDDNRTSFDDSKTVFVGPQRARLVRVDSQMSDYSVCDINLENVKNLSEFVENSSHHDVNQNIKSSLNLSSNRYLIT